MTTRRLYRELTYYPGTKGEPEGDEVTVNLPRRLVERVLGSILEDLLAPGDLRHDAYSELFARLVHAYQKPNGHGRPVAWPRYARWLLFWTDEELAKREGVSVRAVQRWRKRWNLNAHPSRPKGSIKLPDPYPPDE